jgi:hypothetical protein
MLLPELTMRASVGVAKRMITSSRINLGGSQNRRAAVFEDGVAVSYRFR